MAQTAVEWLVNIIDCTGITIQKEFIDKAKEMEKEQITNAYEHGQNNGYMYRDGGSDIINDEQYYNETFGNITHTHVTSTKKNNEQH